MSTYLREQLALLIALLREFQTVEGRRALRARLRAHRRVGVSWRLPLVRSGGSHALSHESATSRQMAQAAAWQPRTLAERLARRERIGSAAREGSPAGGQTVLERYGSPFYSAIGARGGATVVEERGVDYMQDIGARGGAATRQRYGPEHYAEIGRKGGQAGRGRKRPRKHPSQPELPLDAS